MIKLLQYIWQCWLHWTQMLLFRLWYLSCLKCKLPAFRIDWTANKQALGQHPSKHHDTKYREDWSIKLASRILTRALTEIQNYQTGREAGKIKKQMEHRHIRINCYYFLLKWLQNMEQLGVGECINCWVIFTSKIYPLQDSDSDQLKNKYS